MFQRRIKIEVNSTFKTPQGTVQFSGELSQEEADFVIKTGLNYLLSQGALPFKYVDDDVLKNMPQADEDEIQ